MPKLIAGIPSEVLFVTVIICCELALALGAQIQAAVGGLLIYLSSRYFTYYDPWWFTLAQERLTLWLRRAIDTRGRSIRLSSYKAPR